MRREPLRQLWHKALLWGVFVDVAQRGKGVASRLVNACMEQAGTDPAVMHERECGKKCHTAII